MFQSDTDGDALGFDFDVERGEQAVNVARGVACGEDDGASQLDFFCRNIVAA